MDNILIFIVFCLTIVMIFNIWTQIRKDKIFDEEFEWFEETIQNLCLELIVIKLLEEGANVRIKSGELKEHSIEELQEIMKDINIETQLTYKDKDGNVL